MLVTYKYRIHNFDLNDGSLVNMYKLCFLQVIFPYFVKKKEKEKEKEKKRRKIKKRVKSPKRKIKGLRKNINPKKKKEIKNKT